METEPYQKQERERCEQFLPISSQEEKSVTKHYALPVMKTRTSRRKAEAIKLTGSGNNNKKDTNAQHSALTAVQSFIGV